MNLYLASLLLPAPVLASRPARFIPDSEIAEAIDFQLDGMAAFAYALDPLAAIGAGKQTLPVFVA